jgi:hypothetical protein
VLLQLLLLLLLLLPLLLLLLQMLLLLLFLLLLSFLLLSLRPFLLPLLILGFFLLLFLDSMEPSWQRRPPLDSRDLGSLSRNTVARRRQAIPGLITNYDWVALSPKLG